MLPVKILNNLDDYGYDALREPGTKLGEEYGRFALPIIQRRLAQAGIRVAFMLNETFR